MSVRIGHASISEKGTINGAKGDSTGKEVCIRDWYSKPWDYVAIHPDAGVRERHAKAVEAGCKNDNIGYGQNDRNTLNTEAKKVDYDLSKIKVKCNTDCSEFQNVCAVAAKTPGVTHASNGWTTSTMRKELEKAGYKIIDTKTYLTSATYCVRGAIYVKAGSHTVCGLDNGSNYKKTLAKAGIEDKPASSNTSSNSSASKPSTSAPATKDYLSKGDKGSDVKSMQDKLIYIGYSCGDAGADGDFGNDTEKAVIKFQHDNKLTEDGKAGEKTIAKLNSLYDAKKKENASKPSTNTTPAVPTYKVGKTYKLQVELKVRFDAGTDKKVKTHNQLTADARKHDKNKDGALDKGTSVTCRAIKKIGKDIWIKIPSGWCAAYYKGNIYIK